jgi:tetratricopeptide (TPR) repeat protein
MKTHIVFILVLFPFFMSAQNDNSEADGDHFFSRGDFKAAIGYYDRTIEQNDTNSYNFFRRGICKYNIGEFAKAIPDLTKSIQLAPEDKSGFWDCGERTVKIADDFYTISKGFISLQHEYSHAYFYRGLAKYNLKDYRGAILDFSAVIKIDETNAGAFHNRALSYYDLGKVTEAISDCTESIKLDSTQCWVYYLRGVCYCEQNDLERGCLDLSKAGELGAEEAYNAIQHFCVKQ